MKNKQTRTDRIYRALRGLSVGSTAAIFGVVVTRWGADVFELRTWGGDYLDIVEAAADISSRWVWA